MQQKFILAFSLFALNVWASDAKFGGEFTLKEPIKFSEIASEPQKFLGKEVLTNAKVEKVCQKKACWMEVTDGSHRMRVVFKDYGFFVKKDLAPKTVALQGTLQEKTLSVKEQKHFLKDEGKSQAEIDQVKEPKKVFQFVASAVKTENI